MLGENGGSWDVLTASFGHYELGEQGPIGLTQQQAEQLTREAYPDPHDFGPGRMAVVTYSYTGRMLALVADPPVDARGRLRVFKYSQSSMRWNSRRPQPVDRSSLLSEPFDAPRGVRLDVDRQTGEPVARGNIRPEVARTLIGQNARW